MEEMHNATNEGVLDEEVWRFALIEEPQCGEEYVCILENDAVVDVRRREVHSFGEHRTQLVEAGFWMAMMRLALIGQEAPVQQVSPVRRNESHLRLRSDTPTRTSRKGVLVPPWKELCFRLRNLNSFDGVSWRKTAHLTFNMECGYRRGLFVTCRGLGVSSLPPSFNFRFFTYTPNHWMLTITCAQSVPAQYVLGLFRRHHDASNQEGTTELTGNGTMRRGIERSISSGL